MTNQCQSYTQLFDRYRNLFTKYEVISSRKFEET